MISKEVIHSKDHAWQGENEHWLLSDSLACARSPPQRMWRDLEFKC